LVNNKLVEVPRFEIGQSMPVIGSFFRGTERETSEEAIQPSGIEVQEAAQDA